MENLENHIDHSVAIRVDDDNNITLECDTCGEYILD